MIMQKVVSHEYSGRSRAIGYKHKWLHLKLECGHMNVRKASQGLPKRARCWYCEHDAKQAKP